MFIYESFLLIVSRKLAASSYTFPNSHEIAISAKIPKINVIADIPASFGP